MTKDKPIIDLGMNDDKPFRAGGFDRLSRDECELLVLNVLLRTAKGDRDLAAKNLGLDKLTLTKNLRKYAAA